MDLRLALFERVILLSEFGLFSLLHTRFQPLSHKFCINPLEGSLLIIYWDQRVFYVSPSHTLNTGTIYRYRAIPCYRRYSQNIPTQIKTISRIKKPLAFQYGGIA